MTDQVPGICLPLQIGDNRVDTVFEAFLREIENHLPSVIIGIEKHRFKVTYSLKLWKRHEKAE